MTKKYTLITAITDAPAPSAELVGRVISDDRAAYTEFERQMKAHKKHFCLPGHWKDEAAENYAKHHGCVEVREIKHGWH